MAQFKFLMATTMIRHEIYTVEADTLDEARKKAEIGDTIKEEMVGSSGIIDRTIWEKLNDKPNDEERILT